MVIQRFSGNVRDAETRKRSAGPQESLASMRASDEKEHWIISDAQSAPILGQNNLETMAVDSKLFVFPDEQQEDIRQKQHKAKKLNTEATTARQYF
jgi:hypothetical protein